jgi:hypothetical protein
MLKIVNELNQNKTYLKTNVIRIGIKMDVDENLNEYKKQYVTEWDLK